MRTIIAILCLVACLQACYQTHIGSTSDYRIDETIKRQVEGVISEGELGGEMGGILAYENLLIADYYLEDSLMVSLRNEENRLPFKSFFYTQGDTLSIDGAYGLFGGFGFSIKFIDNRPIVYHLLAGDEFPVYSMTETGELQLRIEVPCTNTKLTLSKEPELKESEILYGVVEFESKDYYQGLGEIHGMEAKRRDRIRMDMKIYFKSKYLDLNKM